MKNLQFSPFDIFAVIMILIGLFRGRKRGMSHEFLDSIEWISIVVVGALGYRLLAAPLRTYAQASPGLANVVAYLLIVAVVALIFKSIKRAFGEKIAQGDTFGRLEFPLGMLGGGIRFFCILIFLLALLHAKYSTPAQRAAFAKMQRDNYGSISFPTIDGLQQSVFYESYSGQLIRTNLALVLIQPAGPGIKGETMGRKRERAVDEVMNGK